jgi:hypothetical protein
MFQVWTYFVYKSALLLPQTGYGSDFIQPGHEPGPFAFDTIMQTLRLRLEKPNDFPL